MFSFEDRRRKQILPQYLIFDECCVCECGNCLLRYALCSCRPDEGCRRRLPYGLPRVVQKVQGLNEATCSACGKSHNVDCPWCGSADTLGKAILRKRTLDESYCCLYACGDCRENSGIDWYQIFCDCKPTKTQSDCLALEDFYGVSKSDPAIRERWRRDPMCTICKAVHSTRCRKCKRGGMRPLYRMRHGRPMYFHRGESASILLK